jgi:glycosyltransferase involved in cell wall biosynthesis
MADELRARGPYFDIVHIHSLYQFPSLAASYYARVHRKPYLIAPHGSLDPYLRRHHRFRKGAYGLLVERRDLNNASAIHYTTQDELELAKPVGIRAPGVVAPLGINREEFSALPPRGTFRNLHPELQSGRLVTFLGRLTAKKGLDTLIRAFALVCKAFDDARLIIAGPDDEGHGAQVCTWLKEAGVYDRTLITGMITGDRKLALLADTDVWVLSSYTENFGVAVVEAMACGLPVVISDKVNIHREVTAAKAGLVVPCRAKEVASAIGAILGDPLLRLRLSVAAKRLATVDFTWEAAAAQLSEIYHRIVCSYPMPQTDKFLSR